MNFTPPTLRELDAAFIRLTSPDGSHAVIEHLSLAQGIVFLCPKCYVAKGRTKYGVHSVICWFAERNVPAELSPGPGRWHPMGTHIDDLSFIGPGSFSVKLESGCNWHGYVKHGHATILPG